MTKVAYITSGKIGIHRFTYNELIELKKHDINFVLCLTQLNNGPWMPLVNWEVFVGSKKKSISSFFNLLATNPKLCILLLNKARNMKVLSYFIVALSLYHDIRKDKKISSLHCQMGDKKLYIGYFLKQLLNLPLTVTLHAHELYQRRVYENNSSVRHLFAQCDRIITISNFNSKIITKSLVADPYKVEVMRLFPKIDYQEKVKDKTRILIVANLAEKKGYKVLIEAISKIKRDDFVLWVVGDSYFLQNSLDLNVLIKKYAVEDKVALLGRQGGVTLDIIFSACDVFCLPSITEYYEDGIPAEREGIPVALMEAMAWGKPVIATRHAGNPELVEEILVEERDVDSLKDAIEFLLNNPDKWDEMGIRNKQIIAEKYNKNNVKKLVNIFKELES